MRYLYVILFTLILASCGEDNNHFKIEGKIRNMNQGEFYVYSPDGGTSGVDTVEVQSGEFTYEVPLDNPATFIILFPNFSERPVFAKPGQKAVLSADASHLREAEVSGSDENEQMTNFSKLILHSSPPEILKLATNFIKDNPKSLVSDFLLNKYFIQTSSPDFKKASGMIGKLIANQPGNGRLIQLKGMLDGLSNGVVNMQIPKFSATNLNGQPVSENDMKGKYGVINIWASWSFDSQSLQRQILALKKQYGSRLNVLSISMDVSKSDCKSAMDRDSIKWNTVCDEMAWNSPLVKSLGINTVPDNYIISPDGRIIARNLEMTALKERIDNLLK